jgi:hypothetical protein
MGTSSSDPGPMGRNPLLPPWAEDVTSAVGDASGATPPADAATGTQAKPDPFAPTLNDPGEVASWLSPRTLAGKATRAPSASDRRKYVRRAVRGAVNALGGGASAARSASRGRATAARFGNFLSAVSARGLTAAAQEFGILDYVGRGAEVFLAGLADALAPAGALTEDAIARAALIATLEELFDELDVGNLGLDALEQMTPTVMADVMVKYVANYIYERVLQALTGHIEKASPNPARVRAVELDARRYIDEVVRADVGSTLVNGPNFGKQWDVRSAQRTADRLFVECFRVVAAGLDDGTSSRESS